MTHLRVTRVQTAVFTVSRLCPQRRRAFSAMSPAACRHVTGRRTDGVVTEQGRGHVGRSVPCQWPGVRLLWASVGLCRERAVTLPARRLRTGGERPRVPPRRGAQCPETRCAGLSANPRHPPRRAPPAMPGLQDRKPGRGPAGGADCPVAHVRRLPAPPRLPVLTRPHASRGPTRHHTVPLTGRTRREEGGGSWAAPGKGLDTPARPRGPRHRWACAGSVGPLLPAPGPPWGRAVTAKERGPGRHGSAAPTSPPCLPRPCPLSASFPEAKPRDVGREASGGRKPWPRGRG